MSYSTAEHLLGIYETRKWMIERGTINPTPEVQAGVRLLVDSLRKLPPEEKVQLDGTKERAIFTRASTGELLVQIDFT